MRSAEHIPLLLAGALLALPAAGCKKGRFKEDQVLGGRRISAKTLNHGNELYELNCAACHGDKGDGKGPAAEGTIPRPRNFRLGFFKYISVADSGLPTDDDLVRSARRGVPGTRMPAWRGMPRDDLLAVVNYIKTFSPRWRKRKQQPPIPHVKDPWGKQTDAAEARGEVVYHGAAQCWTCHPAYLPRAELLAATHAQAKDPAKKAGTKPLPVRSDVYRPAVVDTRYGKLTPPDFLKDRLGGGDEDDDLYRTVAAGIGGTPMPTWYKRLPPRDLWAVVHYLKRLLRLKGTPEGKALLKKIKAAHAAPATPGSPAPRQ